MTAPVAPNLFALPSLTINFGGSPIDKGDHMQLDMSDVIAYPAGSLPVNIKADKTMEVPHGVYLVTIAASIVANSDDTFASPIQMTVSAGEAVDTAFPGLYFSNAIARPSGQGVGSIDAVAGYLGQATVSTVVTLRENVAVCYSKLFGSNFNSSPTLEGTVTFIKLADAS